MTYEIAIEQVKRHLGPAYVAAIDAHALAYANQTATAITQRDRHAAHIERLQAALDPRTWTLEMSAAWHKNLPDTHAAFAAISALANIAMSHGAGEPQPKL
jgi:hypothetical protein